MSFMVRLMASLLWAAGGIFLAAALFRWPALRTVRALKKAESRGRGEDALSRALRAGSTKIAALLPDQGGWWEPVAARLRMTGGGAEGKEEAKRFVAECVLKGALAVVLTLPLGLISLRMLPASLIAGLGYGFLSYRKLSAAAEQRKKEIEEALPGFVAYLTERLTLENSVCRLLTGYADKAPGALRGELEKTAADLLTSGEEEALNRLQRRVPSVRVAMVTRGLSGVSRGDTSGMFWTHLSAKMEEEHRASVKEKAAAFPKYTHRWSLALLVCFLLTYLCVIAAEIVQSLGGMFS